LSALDGARIDAARALLEGRIRRTPVEPSPGLAEALGVPVALKLESLQVTGSFKVRGALFRLSRLSEGERAAGIGTCSAGNHGLAVAWAARELGLEAEVYVPSSVDAAKRQGIEALGARIVVSSWPGYDDTEAWARERIAAAGRIFVSAFDEPDVMAGNGGSLALEVLEQLPEARVFVMPVGGGGLSAGFSWVAKERLRDARVVGCQHRGSPGLALSLERGKAVTRLPALETVAGGVEGGLGRTCFEVLRDRVDHVELVSEEEIRAAVRWLLERHRYLVEPSAAVAVAACLAGRLPRFDAPVAVVLTGRNVAIATVRDILAG